MLPSAPPIVNVGVIRGGSLRVYCKWIFQGEEDSTENYMAPAWVFYIHHKASGKKLLFDLGINKNLEDYSPAITFFLEANPPDVSSDAIAGLRQGGIGPKEIDFIAYSHLHWDHIGDCRLFPNAEVILGPGAAESTVPGWPTVDGAFHAWAQQPPSGKLRQLSRDMDEWTSWGPLDRVLDFFGDGSFYLVDTPGHMPGHLNGLARTGQDEWVIMGGDLCHARHFFSSCCGEGWRLSTKSGPVLDITGKLQGLHDDHDASNESISKVAEANKLDSVFVCLAHDIALEGIIPLFPDLLNGWRERGDKQRSDLRAKELGPAK